MLQGSGNSLQSLPAAIRPFVHSSSKWTSLGADRILEVRPYLLDAGDDTCVNNRVSVNTSRSQLPLPPI